jgi:hypothetical protein
MQFDFNMCVDEAPNKMVIKRAAELVYQEQSVHQVNLWGTLLTGREMLYQSAKTSKLTFKTVKFNYADCLLFAKKKFCLLKTSLKCLEDEVL